MLKTTTSVINASYITGVLPVVNGGTGVTTSTGTGSTVLSTSPTLATPILGVASATSVNKVAITAPTTGATLTIAEGKTLTANNSLTFAGTDSTIMTFPTTSATVARTDAANSFTGDQTLATGNLIVSNGKGIDFSASPGTGTSELLADYEEGTWTPIDSSGAGLTFVSATGSYTKVGNLVSASGFVQYPVTASATGATIGGLPFTSANTANRGVGALNYKQTASAATLLLNNNATTMLVVTETGSLTANSSLSNGVLYFGVTYSIP